MQGDMPDGSFSEAELARLEAEGIIEIHQPGTPEWEALTREMAAELPAINAELLAREGPDALTSDRLLRQTALAAELDPEWVAYAFAAWCRSRGWERSDLASWLGVSIDQLAAMAIERRASFGSLAASGVPQVVDLARRYGADPGRLATVLNG